jgi:GNAT superfamily N-acetyltransferase
VPEVTIRLARPEELAGLPALEAAADTLFAPLGIAPLPPPGTAEDLARALVVLVAGDPPKGFARIERLGQGAHLEQLSVHPDHVRQGIGRVLLRAACDWALQHGYRDITLATFRDVAWNGPFYASEGFTEAGIAEEWYTEHGFEPEEPEMATFGTRVIMVRAL